MKHLLISLFVIHCSLFTLAGCGGSGVPVVQVTGSVSYNGAPVAGALVSFVPLSETGRGAAATTEADGSFTVMTQGANKNGAMTGDYAVVVTKIVPVDSTGKEIVSKDDEPYDPRQPQVAETMPEVKNLLPEKYADKAKSGLTAEVKQGKNRFTFELTD